MRRLTFCTKDVMANLSIPARPDVVTADNRCYHHPTMRFDSELVDARFIRRLNRFAALVEIDGDEVMVHVANTGRMRELLTPGRDCPSPTRRKAGTEDGLRPYAC